MNLAKFQGDAALEQKGVWLDFDDAKFLIAANMNPEHKKALARLGKKQQRAFRTEDLDAQDAVIVEATAEAILLDWRNVKVGKPGQEVDFPPTKENKITLLKSSRVLRDFIAEESMRLTNFQTAQEESAKADLKSEPPVAPPVG